MHALVRDNITVHNKLALHGFTRFRDTIGARKLNKMGHVTLTTYLSRMLCYPRLRLLVMINLPTKFVVSTRYEDMKGNAKCRNRSGLGYLWVTQCHWK